jgi:hypothetical protein
MLNYAIIVVGAFCMMAAMEPSTVMASLIILVLGLHWTYVQCRENIDTIDLAELNK